MFERMFSWSKNKTVQCVMLLNKNSGEADNSIAQAPVTLTNLSGNITTGGDAQVLSTAQSQNQTYFIENIDTISEIIWVNFLGGTAAPNAEGSIPLRPQSGTSEGGSRTFTTDKAVSIYAATTGHKFTALRLAQ